MVADILNKLAIILMILVGAYLIYRHRKLGRETAHRERNRLLPLKKGTAKEYSIVFLIFGIILVLVGVLGLFGVVQFKGPF